MATMRHNATPNRRKLQRVDGELREIIEFLAFRRWKAPAIHAELSRQFGKKRTPNLRTIQRWVNKIMPQDPTGPWRIDDSVDAMEAALVLPVIATVGTFDVLRWQPTKAEAEWVVRIRRLAPDLPLQAVPQMVWAYMMWNQLNRDTALLDLVLAVRPWRSFQATQALMAALSREGEEARGVVGLVRQIEVLDVFEAIAARFARQDAEQKEQFIDELFKNAAQRRKEHGGSTPELSRASYLRSVLELARLWEEATSSDSGAEPAEDLHEDLSNWFAEYFFDELEGGQKHEGTYPQTRKQLDRRPRRGARRKGKA